MTDFVTIMDRMLSRVSDAVDKREGSVIYDALAPAAAELAQMYIGLEIWKEQTYLMTATGENLDRRGNDFGVARRPAVKALRIGRMYNFALEPADAPLGSRFAAPDHNGIIYAVEERLEAGVYAMRCERAGTEGNDYEGDVLPLYYGNNLSRAEITGHLIPGEDEESDDDYRRRVAGRLANRAFGGNVADYKRFASEIDGVGAAKVFPVWDGGGTVKISIVDSAYNDISADFLKKAKAIIDPEEYEGEGAGIAPIGHIVTVSTPDRVVVDVEAVLTLDGRTAGQVLAESETGIGEYFAQIRRGWSEADEVSVYASRVAAEILKIPRVLNVTDVRLNGASGDVSLTNDKYIQQIPFLRSLTLYEGGE
ncbi:MAG: baseplate J/gp47 family protein [Clostridiales bacterium]|nr:baseplate J/gp47 family protein [Clostridiales bacterium]